MGSMASQITTLTTVYSTVYSGADQRKHQSSASLAFVRGIHRGPVNSPHKWPVTRKIFPFDDVIMTRYWNGLSPDKFRMVNCLSSGKLKFQQPMLFPSRVNTSQIRHVFVCFLEQLKKLRIAWRNSFYLQTIINFNNSVVQWRHLAAVIWAITGPSNGSNPLFEPMLSYCQLDPQDFREI